VPNLLIFAADLAAIGVLTFGAYYRRHRRRDMILPFIGLNIGVLAVCAVLSGVAIGIGVGLGLFGVLAIIRLRSTELSQEEVAYYFASLALGLIAGLQPNPVWLAPLLSAAIVAIFLALDQPKFHQKHRRQEIVLDAVYATEADLIGRLELLLDATVSRAIIVRTDLVRDLTVVDVRYALRNPGASSPFRSPARQVNAVEDSPAYAATVAR
jgi:Domain of unknown function (DUF4956)